MIGGFDSVVDQLADDYALGEMVRRAGLTVAIPSLMVEHACTHRTARDLFHHELRWARTIRFVDAFGFIGSGVTHAFPLALLGTLLGGITPASIIVIAALACRFSLQMQLDRALRLQSNPFWLGPLRDLLSCAVFFASFFGRAVEWRGRRYAVLADNTLAYTGEVKPQCELCSFRRPRLKVLMAARDRDTRLGAKSARFGIRRGSPSRRLWSRAASSSMRRPIASTREQVAASCPGLRSGGPAHLGAVFCRRRRDHQGAESGESGAEGRACRRQGRGRSRRQPEGIAVDRFCRAQRVRFHHQGGGGRPALERDRRPVLSQCVRRHRPQRRARDPGEYGPPAVCHAGLQTRSRYRQLFHRLSAASVPVALHRARMQIAMHLLPVAANRGRPSLPHALGRPRRRGDRLGAEGISVR